MNKFRTIVILVLLSYALLNFSGCDFGKEKLVTTEDNYSENSAKKEPPRVKNESDIFTKGTKKDETPSLEKISIKTPPVFKGASVKQRILKPTLPVGNNEEPILKSVPIPGQPIIVIYRMREEINPETAPGPPIGDRADKASELDTALKPEPLVAVVPVAVSAKTEPETEPEQPGKLKVEPSGASRAVVQPVIQEKQPDIKMTPPEELVLTSQPAPFDKTDPKIDITPKKDQVPVPVPGVEPDSVQRKEISQAEAAVKTPEQNITIPPKQQVEKSPSTTKEPKAVQIESPTIEHVSAAVAAEKSESTSKQVSRTSEPEIPIQANKNLTDLQPEALDTLPPYIEILSPKSGSFYTKKLQVEGRISVSKEKLDSVKGIDTVTWEISGKKAPEEIFFGSDGVFSISFPTDSISGEVNLIIKAVKKNNKSSSYTLKFYDGNITPELELSSPSLGSVYGAAIRISGKAVDPSAKSLNLTGPKHLSYSMFSVDGDTSEKQIEGEIPVNPDGSFLKDIFTSDLKGDQLVTITVYGRNGRTEKKSVTIVQGESDIPGFKVEQDDDSVKLSWETLPGIGTYNILYSEGGSGASETKVSGTLDRKFENVKSPVYISNFKVGALYRFQVEAVFGDKKTESERVYKSSVRETIVLKKETLQPVVTPGYQQISLVWLNIPGTDMFDILRKDDSKGSFSILKHAVTGSSYVDKDVEFGKKYTYKIKPAIADSIASYAASSSSLAFPEEKSIVLGRYGSSDIQGVTVSRNYLFMADGSDGIKIIDNVDPSSPVEVGHFPTKDARDIVVRGDRAYVADGYRGIKILDIYDPGSPLLLGFRKTADASKLIVSGSKVFIADGKSGVKIIDISDERHPVRSGSLKTVNAKDIMFSGSDLLIADGSGGLKIAAITGPSGLTIKGSIPFEDAAAVSVENNVAFIADRSFGVRIVDVSNPWNPSEIGKIQISGIMDVVVNKNYIFTGSTSEGLKIYEISDPRRPVLFDTIDYSGIKSLTLSNGVIYITDNEGYKTVESFTTGRSFVIAEYKTDGKAYNLAHINNNLYLADHTRGVEVVDVSKPGDSSSFGVIDKLGTSYAESVVGYGSKLLIADGKGGLVIGTITHLKDGKQKIEIEESVDLPGITKSLAVFKNKAYIAAREEGFHVLNLDTRQVGTVFTGGTVQEVAVTENYVVAADGTDGIKLYSNPEDSVPSLISEVKLPNVVTAAITGNYIVAGGRGGLSVIDISMPEHPRIVSSFKVGWVEDVYLTPGYIYAAAGSEGLVVLDMRNPKGLVLVSSCKDVYAVGVEVDNDLAFVADVSGFKVVKILIPSWLQ